MHKKPSGRKKMFRVRGAVSSRWMPLIALGAAAGIALPCDTPFAVAAPQYAGIWAGGVQNTSGDYYSANWDYPSGYFAPAVGDYLYESASGSNVYHDAPSDSYVVLSNTSPAGQYLEVGSNTAFSVYDDGGSQDGYGLFVANDAYFRSDPNSTVNIAGPLEVGYYAGDTNSVAQFYGGTINVGTSSTAYQVLRVGLVGSGEVDQLGSSVVNTSSLGIGDQSASGTGNYNLISGTLVVSGSITMGSASTNNYVQVGGILTANSFALSGGAAQLLGGAATLGTLQVAQGGHFYVGEFANTSNLIYSGGYSTYTDASNDTEFQANPSVQYTQTSQGIATVNGTVTVSGGWFQVGGGGTFSANAISLSSGTVSFTGGTTSVGAINFTATNGTLNLSGGTLSAGSIQTPGINNVFDWTGGTLNLTNSGLTIGNSGLLGSYLTLYSPTPLELSNRSDTLTVSGQFDDYGSVTVAGTLHVTSTGVLNIASTVGATSWINGSLTVGTLQVDPGGSLNYDPHGVLNLTNSSLTIDNGGALGTNVTVTDGGALVVSGVGQSLNISGVGNLIVNGGNVAGTTINQTGGTVTMNSTFNLGWGYYTTDTYNLSGGSLYVSTLETSHGAYNQSGGSAIFANADFSGVDTAVQLTGGTMTITDTYNAPESGLVVSSAAGAPNGSTITFESGAKGTDSSLGLTIGSAGGTGTMIVTGNSSSYTAAYNDAISVGLGESSASIPSTGVLTISNGGQLTGSDSLVVGNGGDGIATVQGSGSTLSTSSLTIGLGGGTGTLNSISGGQVTSYYLDVGDNSTATVSVTSGGLLSSAYAMVGVNQGYGSVIVSGTGSSWTAGAVAVGFTGGFYPRYGTGTVTVSSGATLSVTGLLSAYGSPNSIINLAGGSINTAMLQVDAPSGLNWTSGTLIVTDSIISTPAISVPSAGKLIFEPSTANVTTLDALSIAPGGALDLNNNHIFINYGSSADPIASIATWIASGYANGTWTGSGIMSTMAQGDASYGIGYADSADPGNPANLPSGTIEIMYTLLGDANLDGKVNGADFTLMAANFNDSVTSGWDEGDFNYDGVVNGSDFVLLADNFNDYANQSAVSAADLVALDSFAAANGISLTNVPEPTCVGAITMIGFGVLHRRRRSASAANPKCYTSKPHRNS